MSGVACNLTGMAKNRPPPSPKAIAVGRRIAEARAKLGWSQETLARMLSVTKGLIGQYEIGLTSPRANRMADLAKVLAVDVEWLLTGNEPDEKVRAQTATELAALHLLRAMHPDKHAAVLAMMQGLAGPLSKM